MKGFYHLYNVLRVNLRACKLKIKTTDDMMLIVNSPVVIATKI